MLVDERYAHAQAVKKMESEFASQVRELRVDNTRKFYRAQVQNLRQKKLEIEVKPHKSTMDQALVANYDTQIRSLQQEEQQEVNEIRMQ